MSEKEAQGKLASAKATQESAKGTTKKAAKKAAARPGPRADKADGESAVLAKIAAMPEPDRAMGERLHAIIKANAPPSRRDSGTGCPRMPGTARSSASSTTRRSSKTRYVTLGFMHEANLDEGACGRPPSR